ncbi:MAG: ribosome recycling factor [Patescibacteria group bacterium]
MAYDLNKLRAGTDGVYTWLQQELTGLRTGRASPALLDGVSVEVYGARMKISQIATISVEDARSLYISPWDKGQLKPIERAISIADLGVGVGSDAVGVRVTFPELTTERRQQLIKLVRGKLEEARVSLKGERLKAMDDVDSKEKGGTMSEDASRSAKDEVQKVIDESNKRLEELSARKEKELES